MKSMGEFTTRSFDEFEVSDAGVLTGTPIKFNSPTIIHTRSGDYEETIAPTSVNDSLLKDVVLFVNHDNSRIPLARTRNKTMELEIREDGVHMTATLNLNRNDCKDAYEAVKDGTISGMSFGFRIKDDIWTECRSSLPKREIRKFGYIQEVSLVTKPSYGSTDVQARSADADDNALKAMMESLDRSDKEHLELEKLKALAIY